MNRLLNWLGCVKVFLFVAVLFLFPKIGQSTHLIGGNLGYIDLGVNPIDPTEKVYRVYFQAYLDCNSASWGSTFPEPSIELGIYEGGIGQATVNLVTTENAVLADSNFIDPNLPSSCSFTIGSCTYLVTYSADISLPISTNGYHIIYDRCCRPSTVINVFQAGNESLTYAAYVPAAGNSLITNNTPIFTDTLVTYVCLGENSYVSNSAVDIDGDSLDFQLVTPYDGLTSSANPLANYTNFNPYPNPPPSITWAAGYNLNNIFGVNGYQSINHASGSCVFMANLVGNYAAAVEISEYRNGILISRTRRDMQIEVLNCPSNPIPNMDSSNLSPNALSPYLYEIEAGDSICFDLKYDDVNNDTLTMDAQGLLFTSNVTPSANISYPSFGSGTITAQFCWGTDCSQAQSTTYNFNVTVTDNGCTPKSLIETYDILITPFDEPTAISGPINICSGTTNTYTADGDSSATFNWSIVNGTILTGQGSSTIVVQWSNSNTGSITVNATSANGCIGNSPVSLNVNISNLTIDAGLDQNICTGQTATLGGSPTSSNPNVTYLWSPSTGLDFDTVPNPTASPTSSTSYILTVNDTMVGCTLTDTVNVTTNATLDIGLADEYFICPGDTISLNAVNTNNISWTPSTGLSNANIPNPNAFSTLPIGYEVNFIDTNGCAGIDSVQILSQGFVPTNAGQDRNICFGNELVLGGNPTSPDSTIFSWTSNHGNFTDSIANPVVQPNVNTIYYLSTANDTCVGFDTISVIVNSMPNVTILTQNTTICYGDSINLGAVGTQSMVWYDSTTLSNATGNSTTAFPTVSTTYYAVGTNSFNCSDTDSVVIMVQDLPQIAIPDTQHICKNQFTAIGDQNIQNINATWTPSLGLDNANNANPSAQLDSNMLYSISFTDSLGCSSSKTTYVNVFYAQKTGLDTALCSSEFAALSMRAFNGLEPYSYNWLPSNGILGNVDSNFVLTTLNATTEVLGIVADLNGCFDTVSYDITVLPQATADFEYSTAVGCDGYIAYVNYTGENADNVEWLINGTVVEEGTNAELTLNYAASSNIQVIATNEDGCNDTTDIDVNVDSFSDIMSDKDVPNVFTPNGDGYNDYFELGFDNALQECSKLYVYSRWGQLIFESNQGYTIWDGTTFNGEIVSDGVYFYIYTINGIEYKNTVTVVTDNTTR